MIKRNKWILFVTSLVILLPLAVGLILWNQLPEQMPTHWGADGQVDGYSSKLFGVLGLPLFMLGIHWLCVVMTAAAPKHNNVSGKALHLVFWICPATSLIVGFITYGQVLGLQMNVTLIMLLLMGVLFFAIGNYLPKCKQNYTVGIKLPWTLNDEANWDSTHRFAGKLWVVGGLLILATAFLQNIWIFLGIVMVMSIVPMIYSYLYYRKHTSEE